MARKLIVWFVLCTFTLQVVGCTYERPIAVEAPDGKARHFDSKHGWQIVGYVTKDGIQHPFHGWAALAADNRVRFVPEGRPRSTEAPYEVIQPFSLPRPQVASLVVEDPNLLGQMAEPILIAGAIVVALSIVAYIAMAIYFASHPISSSNGGSCPFLFSRDGDRWLLDGEPYGGAISLGLQRSDTARLDFVRPFGGTYRLLLTNPSAGETQHTNRLDLLVVDAPPGSRVVVDESGVVHAFASVAPLVAARDAGGADLTRTLRAADVDIWNSDLDAACEHLPLADTREHLELEFARPPGVDAVSLVARVASSQASAPALADFLALHGDAVGDFYAAIDADSTARQALLAWNDREELMRLFVSVREGDTWVRQGAFFGGSPWVGESRAIPIDLRRVTGDRVRLRLDPPVGFWSLNSFELAWDETPATVTPVELLSAVDQNGADVRERLRADDDAYLDFPDTASHALLEFAVPPQAAGLERSVFARTRGWYEMHTRAAGPPDVATLARLQREPGLLVQRLLAGYAAAMRAVAQAAR